MKRYDQRTYRVELREARKEGTETVLRREEREGQYNADRGCDGSSRRKSSRTRIDSERTNRKDSEASATPDDRGTNLGGVADQFAADCVKRLAENKAQIESHKDAIASLEKSNKVLIEQLARIEELKQKMLTQPED